MKAAGKREFMPSNRELNAAARFAQGRFRLSPHHRFGPPMKNHLSSITTRAALVLALAIPFGAQAGLVTGNWDPLFGPALPGLTYQVRAEFFVPDACSQQGDGTFSAVGACAGATVLSARLRLFDTGFADANNFFELSANSYNFDLASPVNGYGVKEIRVLNEQVLGVAAGAAINLPALTPPAMGTFNGVVATALNNSFGLHFTVNGPVVTCIGCTFDGDGRDDDADPIFAGTTGLTQVLTSFNDSGNAKLVDADGKAIGVRLDETGNRIGLTGTPVPEPGSLALVLGALASAAGVRRRRA